MSARICIFLSVIGLVSILAACGPAPAVNPATNPPSTAVGVITPTAESADDTETSLSFDCRNIREIPVEECRGLLALYTSTKGHNWEGNSGWVANQTPCTWHGVICDQGHVIELQLYYNQLDGSLPPEIGNFTHLKSLYLDDNQLSGPIPAEIGNLTELQTARLGKNQFTSIPAELANLKDLIFLELWGNQLMGEIPGGLDNLSKLQFLNLSSNQFTGEIPLELGKLVNLTQLNLSHNQLTGPIPAALADLTKLNELDISHNQLTGSIPTEFADLTDLYWLDLSYNQLTGEVPTGLAKAPIAELRLWGNQLEGTILVSEEKMTSVDYGGVNLEISSALAKSVWREVVAAQPSSPGGPGWDVRPEHVRFTLAGPREQNNFEGMRVGTAGQPQILIYPAHEFSAMSEFANAEIEELKKLLEARPPAPENEIPLLPLINAAQVFHAQVEYLEFQNGTGVRFITHYSQEMSPVVNQNIFYTFQGLTADGNYYVAAYFPVTAEGLLDEPVVEDWDVFFAGYQDYLTETVGHLNALSPDEFEPRIEMLDALIQSLAVNAP